ncbi:unnamed protein product [Agarophyton chilense]|eukprot:gb/GEZJ01002407.1/.p1 GENE.gb/GEZJ01002407.1/~~gb/GEZJ01002407.1/.p1  ORF type:complete len:434 (-),score=61.13 gb/GEZJ01002407.1/:1143-2444(-)
MDAMVIRHALPRVAALSAVPTIRSITGVDVCPPRAELASTGCDEDGGGALRLGKARISSVTDSDSRASSPRATPPHPDRLSNAPLRRRLPDLRAIPPGPSHSGVGARHKDHKDDVVVDDDNDDNEDAGSTYSHASVLNLDDLEDDEHHVLATRLQRYTQRLSRSRQWREWRGVRGGARNTRGAVVLARDEYQSHNCLEPLFERAVHALVDAVDADALSASAAVASYRAFSPLYTNTERTVVSSLFRNASAQLRREAPTPWRSPLVRETVRVQLPDGVDEALVRGVMYGAHVLPGAGAETILIRLAAAYHREQLRKRYAKARRVMVPLSFAMTLTALLAALSRLECSMAFRRLRSRAATRRVAEPHAVVAVRAKYDGARLAFDVSLHGDAPCTVLFRKPRLLPSSKLADFNAIVAEVATVITDFGHVVSAAQLP